MFEMEKPSFGSFWSRLRDFLTKQPVVKAPRSRARGIFAPMPASGDFWESMREACRPLPVEVRGAESPFLITPGSGWTAFWNNLREWWRTPIRPGKPAGSALSALFHPAVPSLEPPERMQSQGASLLVHGTLIVLAILAGSHEMAKPQEPPKEFGMTNISPYQLSLPPKPDKKQAGGGGGGGERNPVPASKGRLPKQALQQLTPPVAVIRNPNPKLAAEPTVVVPPDIRLQSPNVPQYGDPLAQELDPSGGPGAGGGIGSGVGGGIGSGMGPGVGPGWGGGIGGGVFRIGGTVSAPVCLYCPDPEYSEDARKAKYQGVVEVFAIVGADGRVIPESIQVVKPLGMGLDEQAVRAVQQWRFTPAQRFGKAVPVQMNIEVNFRLL